MFDQKNELLGSKRFRTDTEKSGLISIENLFAIFSKIEHLFATLVRTPVDNGLITIRQEMLETPAAIWQPICGRGKAPLNERDTMNELQAQRELALEIASALAEFEYRAVVEMGGGGIYEVYASIPKSPEGKERAIIFSSYSADTLRVATWLDDEWVDAWYLPDVEIDPAKDVREQVEEFLLSLPREVLTYKRGN